MENPYYFAFKAITDALAQHQADLGIDEPVDIIFDDESEKVRLAGVWDMLKLSSLPEIRKNMRSRAHDIQGYLSGNTE